MRDPLIFEIPQALPPGTCRAIIEQFEKDPARAPGITTGGFKPDVKLSTDLKVSSSGCWQRYDEILCSSLHECFMQYLDHLTACDVRLDIRKEFRDGGYNIHKYDQGAGHYDWHQDSHILQSNEHRAFTLIWYLNTVKEGGETLFRGRVVSPVEGKALIFPATFTYMHKGCMPVSSAKYICNAFLLWPNR